MDVKEKNTTFYRKSFGVFNSAPSNTQKIFFLAKYIYIYIFTLMKSVFCINSIFLLWQYTDVVKKILCKYFKFCISKSFMRPRFFFKSPFMSYDITNLGNSFSQIIHFISSSGWSMSSTYNSFSVYVLECIMLLCFISLSSFIQLRSH